ncbi:hypothetical protein ZHAS_00006975 [Anopheles sinensis]|uniref:Uncharacterized protein n=1 Tax=Anopheles sinensis TaxID=74873 RepID=A0A084VND6_ANOSI|nr:hypothetical protein ZHAS_00006975 [Anopheles sinensis]
MGRKTSPNATVTPNEFPFGATPVLLTPFRGNCLEVTPPPHQGSRVTRKCNAQANSLDVCVCVAKCPGVRARAAFPAPHIITVRSVGLLNNRSFHAFSSTL